MKKSLTRLTPPSPKKNEKKEDGRGPKVIFSREPFASSSLSTTARWKRQFNLNKSALT